MSPDLLNISADDLRRAAEIREKLESLQEELSQILEGKAPAPKKKGRKPGSKSKTTKKKRAKRKLSPEAIEKIREGQRKRWAKKKKTKAKSSD